MSAPLVDSLLASVRPEFRTGAGIGLLVLTLLGLGLYVVKPTYLTYRKLADDRERAETLVSENTSAAGAIAALRSEVSTASDALYGGASGIPSSEMESFVIDSLDSLAKRHGVALRGVAPAAASEVLAFREIPFEVRVRGRYADLYRWLHGAEDALRPMVVKEFVMEPDGAREAVTMNLEIVAYRSPAAGR